jgi:hypothetical protein
MFFDVENEIDERRYLLLMFALQTSEDPYFVSIGEIRAVAAECLGSPVEHDELFSLYHLGLIQLLPGQGREGSSPDAVLKLTDDDTLDITRKGLAVLINAAPRLLDQIMTTFDVPEGAAAALVPLLDVTRVPAADRYVSTADNQEVFAELAAELENVKGELVRDLNANELPILSQNKRAMVAELDGLIGQIRAGYVRLSDLTQRARPLVKSIADTCKDVGVIAGFAYAAYEIIGKILISLF